jgi:hypothetical protein
MRVGDDAADRREQVMPDVPGNRLHVAPKAQVLAQQTMLHHLGPKDPGEQRRIPVFGRNAFNQAGSVLPGRWRIEVRDRGGWVGALDLVLSNRAA